MTIEVGSRVALSAEALERGCGLGLRAVQGEVAGPVLQPDLLRVRFDDGVERAVHVSNLEELHA